MTDTPDTYVDHLLAFGVRKREAEMHSMLAKANALATGLSIVRVSDEGVRHISPEDFYVQPPTEEERRLMALTDEELSAEIAACPVDVLEGDVGDLLYGEAERRDLDI